MRDGQAANWRRFLADFLLTIVVGILFGALWILLDRATAAGAPLASWAPFRVYVVALFGLIVGLLFMRAVGRLVRGHLQALGDQGHDNVVRLFFNLLVAFIIVLYLAFVFGVNLQNVFLGSALAGVVLGLASQTVLGNVFAGITIVLWGPFRNGERVGIISWQYGAIGPSYPHESIYPTYVGTVVDIGLLYTVLRLDNGRLAKVPNSIVIQALVVNLSQSPVRALRVRMTFPMAVSVATADAALAALGRAPGFLAPDRPAPSLQVVDLSATSWDGLVTLWTDEPDEDRVRDVVLRALLARAGPGIAAGPEKKP